MAVAVYGLSLAIEHAQLAMILIKVVKASFQQARGCAVFGDEKVVFRMDLVHLDHGVAAANINLRVDDAWRNHPYRTVITNPKKDAGRQQNLGFARISSQRLSRLQLGSTDRFRVEGPLADRSLTFNVVQSSWLRRDCARLITPRGRIQDRGQEEAQERLKPWRFHDPTSTKTT
jgi:hypothetical protein